MDANMHMLRQAEASLKQQQVKELIGLLDRYLFARGEVFITPLKEDIAPPPRTQDDRPASLSIFPSVSLRACLDERDQERRDALDLELRIVAICLDPAIVRAAKETLNEEYRNLDEKYRTADIESIAHLTQKLKGLRQIQQRAQMEPNRKFRSFLAARITDDGQVTDTQPVWAAEGATWEEYESVLRIIMRGEGQQLEQLQECTFEEVKWIYQTFKDGYAPDKTTHELGNGRQYRHMRQAMTKDELEVLVWHERVWDASKEAREETEQFRKESSIDFGAKGDEGWKEWNDLWPTPEEMGTSRVEIRVPSIEPLSDE